MSRKIEDINIRKQVKKKNIQEIENNVHYHGCTFYVEDNIKVNSCIFEHCSFRTDLTIHAMNNCFFLDSNFSGNVTVDLRNLGLKDFPRHLIMDDISKYIDRLYLDGNNIYEFPHMFLKSLKKLKFLSMSNNLIQEMNHNLFDMKELEYLDLSGNKMERLPNELPVKLPKLKWLNVWDNPLYSIPHTFHTFQNDHIKICLSFKNVIAMPAMFKNRYWISKEEWDEQWNKK